MNRYELQLSKTTIETPNRVGLADASIMKNAGWFVSLRWFVVSVFIVSGAIGFLFESALAGIGISLPYWWLWGLATVLLAANLPLHAITGRFDENTQHSQVVRILWAQITLDLIVVTVLVYNIGTVETFAAFTYLFHIVLACIFFPHWESLLVTCVAALLYLVLVILETARLLPPSGIFLSREAAIATIPFIRIALAAFGVIIWFIVWYITSTLSQTVRTTDQQLSIANDRLILADEEKNTQMLITTHDLKAPFAGIESNIQVLKYQHWDEIPENVRGIIERIDNRAHMLRDRINAILVLGNLKSKTADEISLTTVPMQSLIAGVIDTLHEKAEAKNITLDIDIPEIEVSSDIQQLTTLFANLISNAINYSKDRGTVTLSAVESTEGVSVSIRDQGIGIREDALPEIFDEYFRTKEASRFNRQSTGLGLAIVKVIAEKLKLKVYVESEMGKGTNFVILIPHAAEP